MRSELEIDYVDSWNIIFKYEIIVLVNCILNVVFMLIFVFENSFVLVVILMMFLFCLLLIIFFCSLVFLDFFVGFVV